MARSVYGCLAAPRLEISLLSSASVCSYRQEVMARLQGLLMLWCCLHVFRIFIKRALERAIIFNGIVCCTAQNCHIAIVLANLGSL